MIEEIGMSTETGKLKAVQPAQIAKEMLSDALGQIQDIKNVNLNVDNVTASVAKAVGALFAVQMTEPDEPGHVAGVRDAMDHLRNTLEMMQEVAGEDQALTNATTTIAKTLAILYPASKIQERQKDSTSRAPSILGDQLPEDTRRSVHRVAIAADVGFQSESNFFTGFSEDISAGGIFVATFVTQPIGAKLAVNFTLPDGYLISTEGTVRWVREYNETAKETEPGMGVQFEDLLDKDKAAIESFLSQREPMFYDS
jgi:uncharacterized protein (TIGR02266 family)